MRGGNRGTVAYPLMQTEPLQTAQAIFLRKWYGCLRMFTDVYGCLRMFTDVYGCGTQTAKTNACRIITVQKESFSPGSNALHHTRTARMPQA